MTKRRPVPPAPPEIRKILDASPPIGRDEAARLLAIVEAGRTGTGDDATLDAEATAAAETIAMGFAAVAYTMAARHRDFATSIEDAFQESFAGLLRAIRRHSGDASGFTVYACSYCRSSLRKAAETDRAIRRPSPLGARGPLTDAPGVAVVSDLDVYPSPAFRAESDVRKGPHDDAVREAVAALPPHCRAATTLVYGIGDGVGVHTCDEAAAAFPAGKTVEQIHGNTREGRRRLRRSLAGIFDAA